MVARPNGVSAPVGLVVVVLIAGACGGQSSRSIDTEESGGKVGSGASTGGSNAGTGGASSGTGGTGGTEAADPELIELVGPPCEDRPYGDCKGVLGEHTSAADFDATPRLADCAQYVSYDGCGKLVFSFGWDGCATSVGPGPGGWKASEHLAPMRECLTEIFNARRFACVAGGTFSYDESCYIR